MATRDPRKNHGEFQRLLNSGDLDGLVELYAEDAVYVPARGQRLEGREAVRSVLAGLIESGAKLRMELVELVEAGEVALERARYHIEVPDPDGVADGNGDGERMQITGDSNLVLRRAEDGCWRILIDDPGVD